MKILKGVNRFWGRSLALLLSISLVISPSYPFSLLNARDLANPAYETPLFSSEALIPALIEAWHEAREGDLAISPHAVIRRTKELVAVARAYEYQPDSLTLAQLFYRLK